MAAKGHEIGAHTQTHQHLSLLAAEQRTAEIAGSKQELIAHGLAPLTFAYPYGDYGYPTSSIGMIVKNAGYLGARDSDAGYNGIGSGHGVPKAYYLWSEAGEIGVTPASRPIGYPLHESCSWPHRNGP